MASLQRDPAEVREFVENVDPNNQGLINFDEFLNLMQQVETQIVKTANNQESGDPNAEQLQ